MFVGRKMELNDLNERFASGKFEFAVIYGRRRIGKTALINEFIKDKDSIYCTGVESNEKQNLANLSKAVLEYETGSPIDTSFPSFQAAFEHIFELSRNKRIVFIMDEYPYIARSSASLASTLQMLIDRNFKDSKLFLILCGSSMSYMEDHVLAYKAPLYGRRTAQFRIKPFTFFEACHFFQKKEDFEKLLLYGMVGGTPQYLLEVADDQSFEETLKRAYLRPSSFLYDEPNTLMRQELREPATYNAIISAVANGCSKLGEISNKVGESTNVCNTYIKNLISLGIMKKEYSYGETSNRKAVYAIEDNMFRFWFRFIPDNVTSISRGASDAALSLIRPHISEFMGPVFEEVCIQYLWELLLAGKSPFVFQNLGRWWGTDPKTKMQVEIDIVGSNGDTALFGECKWKNEKIDVGVLDKLMDRSRLFHYKNQYFYLFSKTGFTEGCKAKASELGNVFLITYTDILQFANEMPSL